MWIEGSSGVQEPRIWRWCRGRRRGRGRRRPSGTKPSEAGFGGALPRIPVVRGSSSTAAPPRRTPPPRSVRSTTVRSAHCCWCCLFHCSHSTGAGHCWRSSIHSPALLRVVCGWLEYWFVSDYPTSLTNNSPLPQSGTSLVLETVLVVHHLWLGCGVVFGPATPASSLAVQVSVFSAITRGRFRLGLARNFVPPLRNVEMFGVAHIPCFEGAKNINNSKQSRWRRQDGQYHSAQCGCVPHSLVCSNS